MKTLHLNVSRLLATLALGLSLGMALATPATAADSATPMKQEWMRRHQEMREERMKKMAGHLGIQASQEQAWRSFTDALKDMKPEMKRPAAGADAATLARFGADTAMARAQKMSKLADATAQLQAVLTPEQRKTFDKMAWRAVAMKHQARFHQHRHHRHHPWQGQHAAGQKSMPDMPSQPAAKP